MGRKTLCTLSTANLLHNLEVLREKTPRAKIMAMVKANAYGHGIRSISQRLSEQVDALGVASIDEAMALRQAKVMAPITLIEGVFSTDELALASELDFSVVFHSDHQLAWLKQDDSVKVRAWLKVNTGMGRLGFPPEKADAAMRVLSESSSTIGPIGIMSHFACADEPEQPMNKYQIDTFRAFAEKYPASEKSLCNSAAIFAFPEVHYDWVRPGIALYGASPLANCTADSLGLKPVMTFHTEVIAIQKFKRGDDIGYGASYKCPEDMPVGIAAVGYGDGYPRLVHDKAFVLIDGELCPVVGRVAMDMAAVDLRPCPNAAVGDKVVLWGNGLPVESLSSASDRVAYDLLTGVQNRVKFLWKAEEEEAHLRLRVVG